MSVTVNPRIQEGPPMSGSLPYGRTNFGGIDRDSIRITTRCSAQAKNKDPDSPQNANKTCICRLDAISFDADFVIRYNPKRITKGWLDWDTKDAYTANSPKKPNDCKLDKANVEIHERSHIEDIVKKIREEIEKMIEKHKNDYVCQRQCRFKDRCAEELKKMIAGRIAALGNAAWNELTSHAETHYRESNTERTARNRQCEDFRNRLKEAEKKKKKKPSKKPKKQVDKKARKR